MWHIITIASSLERKLQQAWSIVIAATTAVGISIGIGVDIKNLSLQKKKNPNLQFNEKKSSKSWWK